MECVLEVLDVSSQQKCYSAETFSEFSAREKSVGATLAPCNSILWVSTAIVQRENTVKQCF